MKKQKGSIIIFSLLLTSGLLVVALGLANILVPAFQSNRAVEEGINAYYAAESCMENGLMQFVRLRGGVANLIVDPATDSALGALNFSNSATCNIVSKNLDSFTVKGNYRRSNQYLSIYQLQPCNVDPLTNARNIDPDTGACLPLP